MLIIMEVWSEWKKKDNFLMIWDLHNSSTETGLKFGSMFGKLLVLNSLNVQIFSLRILTFFSSQMTLAVILERKQKWNRQFEVGCIYEPCNLKWNLFVKVASESQSPPEHRWSELIRETKCAGWVGQNSVWLLALSLNYYIPRLALKVIK